MLACRAIERHSWIAVASSSSSSSSELAIQMTRNSMQQYGTPLSNEWGQWHRHRDDVGSPPRCAPHRNGHTCESLSQLSPHSILPCPLPLCCTPSSRFRWLSPLWTRAMAVINFQQREKRPQELLICLRNLLGQLLGTCTVIDANTTAPIIYRSIIVKPSWISLFIERCSATNPVHSKTSPDKSTGKSVSTCDALPFPARLLDALFCSVDWLWIIDEHWKTFIIAIQFVKCVTYRSHTPGCVVQGVPWQFVGKTLRHLRLRRVSVFCCKHLTLHSVTVGPDSYIADIRPKLLFDWQISMVMRLKLHTV